ncbi:molybdopterin molybdochelatase [Nonlabens sp. Hel1_33_55]|uniref:molybdopterin molybdotransferase MoeA n=1 Tax=Nonlabens sp. Hel1_33_55 TaxID=1336802 RepID=UPI000875BDAD|nr:molybdopterin molybdotransferase MoeA [Nonlabens sp. Hel1_33_55]SCX98802.1 molybdopterin molybdochelatase [Nonlabens sp. Hel1_33_55]
MVTIEQALEIIQQQKVKHSLESKDLDNCLGYSLSEDIYAPFDMPSFDNSAMDGYALCGIHQEYTIIGEVAAGDDATSFNLKDGQAVRIFTGAPVPKGTVAVMMQENTGVEGSNLLLEVLPKEGQSIRPKGAELQKGELVFKKGHYITPATIGLLGSLGMNSIPVIKKSNIKLITTGNELVAPGHPKSSGQIFESNSFALAAACTGFGFFCDQTIQIEDDFEAIKSGIKSALDNSDVLILSGGISVGDYDFVKQALEENGVEEQFYKVFQKPGKPLYFGRKANQFVFALPGNPASSLSCFYLYVLPLLYKLSGSTKSGLPQYKFPLKNDFENKTDRPSFLKANVENGIVEILNGQGSSMLRSMAHGNAIAFVDADISLKKGNEVVCYITS